MTRPSTPPILSELRSPSSPATQVAALKALKNEIIGHEQKKEMWIGLGVIAPIARILTSHRCSGKRRYREVNGNTDHFDHGRSRTEDEEARLQAIIIVGSLAHGGPAYLPPLSAGSIFPALLSILCPTESHPQLVLAALRALNTIAGSLLLEPFREDNEGNGFVEALYTDIHLTSLAQILDQSPISLIAEQQISLAAALVTKTCHEETHRKTLALSGVLEALSRRLSSFVVATSVSTTLLRKDNASAAGCISPATTRSRLAPILQSIGTVITGSKQRASQFAHSPAFVEVFLKAENETSTGSLSNSRSVLREVSSHPNDQHLPPIWAMSYRDSLAPVPGVPLLSSSGNRARHCNGFSSALQVTPTDRFSITEEDELPLVTWLVQVVRAEAGVTRLMASWVLVLLYRFGFTHRQRDAEFALLIVPMLVRMLDNDYRLAQGEHPSYDNNALDRPDWVIKEHTPSVLAMLVSDSLEFQKAAVDAGAIKKLSHLLKQSYDPVLGSSSVSMWSPTPASCGSAAPRDSPSASRLGSGGLSPIARHVVQMRESVLIALAAMATTKDEYRKSIIDNGVVPFVIESLKLHSKTSPAAGVESGVPAGKASVTGNPTKVLLAACGTSRALSRSVSTLRTSLIDAGLATPLYVLLRHEIVEVQIAATAVICNLVLEFSPMREAIMEAGIIKVLCEHAHSVNAELRLNSVWALKHLVHTATNAVKMKCLEELGPGWLKQIICSDTEDLASSIASRGSDRDMSGASSIAMGTPNAAGEQVDLLNAVEDDSNLSSRATHESDEDDDEVNMIDSIGALSKPSHSSLFDSKRSPPPERNAKRPTTPPETDSDTVAQARRDDIAVQEQGLDFIRNLICGEGSAEMIDYIFRELGQDKVFDLLASKLRPKTVDAFARDRRSGIGSASGSGSTQAGGGSVKHIPPQPEIVISVLYILIHIAAGEPRHRQLLVSQTELLKLIIPLFSHPTSDIRGCCAWVVINLTWMDDQNDKLHARSRAYELRKLGVVERLEVLDKPDEVLDVRERAKTALHQLGELLR